MARHANGAFSQRAAKPLDVHLEGARLAARGMAHTLNNDLSQVLGRLSLVLARTDLPPGAREELQRSEAALWRLNRHLEEFQHIVRVVTRETPDGPALELEPSIRQELPGGVSAASVATGPA